MELEASIHAQLADLSEQGNAKIDDGDPLAAVELFSRALQLLPEPKTQWEAATWLNSSLGEAYFSLKSYSQAKNAFLDALNCPDAVANPFILLRLGECLYELGDFEKSKDYLIRAYMLEGNELFESEAVKYFDSIRSEV